MEYYLHDSVISTVQFLKAEKKIQVFIELCNWMQEGYVESDPELLDICMTFEDVESCALSTRDFEFQDNGILDVAETGKDTVKFVFFADNDVETMTITAKKISFSTSAPA